MAKYLISTQSYGHEVGQEIPTEYGYLVETDFHNHHRLLKIDTPVTGQYSEERLKPGLRGLHYWNGNLYTASWNTVYIIDPHTLQIKDSVSHPLMSDLHGLYVDDSGIWIASSLMDLVLKFDHNWNLLGVLQTSLTQAYPQDLRQGVDLDADYRLRGKTIRGFLSFHANHVWGFNNKYVVVTGRGNGQHVGKLMLVDRESLEHEIWLNYLNGPHDGLWLDWNTYVVTETNSSSVAFIHRWSPRRTYPFFGVRCARRTYLSKDSESKFWTRGLCKTEEGHLLVGKSVWAGSTSDANASVVAMHRNGQILSEYSLDFLEDYSECRIFQIIPAPYSL